MGGNAWNWVDFVGKRLEIRVVVTFSGLVRVEDFEFFPWGNAYFVTSECQGSGATQPGSGQRQALEAFERHLEPIQA